MTAEQEQSAPTPKLQSIVSGVDAEPSLAEVDAHIGTFYRRVHRLEAAFGRLVDHCHELEQDAVQHAHDLYVRDTRIIGLNAQVETLQTNVKTIEDHAASLADELAGKTEALAGLVAPHGETVDASG